MKVVGKTRSIRSSRLEGLDERGLEEWRWVLNAPRDTARSHVPNNGARSTGTEGGVDLEYIVGNFFLASATVAYENGAATEPVPCRAGLSLPVNDPSTPNKILRNTH